MNLPLIMISLFAVFLGCYSGGFFLYAFLRKWYSLLLGVLTPAILIFLADRAVPIGDAPGLIVVLPMIGAAIWGAVAGFLAAATILIGGWREWNWTQQPRDVLRFFFLSPLVVMLVPSLLLLVRAL